MYRMGEPGSDTIAHVRFAGGKSVHRCACPRFERDDAQLGPKCGRMATKLCDGHGCDIPVCDKHVTSHRTKPNTDFCPAHAGLAE